MPSLDVADEDVLSCFVCERLPLESPDGCRVCTVQGQAHARILCVRLTQ